MKVKAVIHIQTTQLSHFSSFEGILHDQTNITEVWLADIGTHHNKSGKRIAALPIIAAILEKYTTNANPIFQNKSYSGSKIAIAISDQPVGIDIEFINQTFDYNDMLTECFSAEEISEITNHKDFFKGWTRKEALLKATKLGITDEIKLIPTSDGEHELPSVLGNYQNDWNVYTITTDGYQLTVASAHKQENIKYYQFTF
ncbi:MAG: 4'-phosphopantetheinyl transferase superfamily protein [Pedobacter sp.]|nr:MAG: 4'-phosphopantetheinyl transferase superfamily protein [Pedobacter sp.]